MKKSIKTKVCIIGCLIAFCGVSAYADCIQDGNETVIVSGDLGAENAGKMISLDVYKGKDAEGKQLLSMNADEYLSFIVCHDQTRTDDNGKYTFTFDIDNTSGYYTAQTALEGESEVIRENFYYVNVADFENARDKLNSAETADEVLEYIEEYGGELGFFSDEYELISDKKAVAGIILEMIKNEEIGDRNEGIAVFRKAVLVQSLNEKRIKNIFEYEETAGFADSDISDYYSEAFVTDSLRRNMTERLSGNAYKSYSEYYGDLTESFVLAVVKYPNGYENIKTVVKEFASEIGVPSSYVTDSAAKKIAGEDIKSFSGLKSRFAELYEQTGSSGGGSGSGGSKGSGGVNNGGVYIDSDSETITKNTNIEPDIFTDLDDAEWAKEAIIGLAERGIAAGDGNGRFMPNNSVSREEFVKLIVCAFGIDTSKISADETRFSDVSENDWFYPYIYTAVRVGIVKGMSDSTFGVGNSITREDLAVIAYRALNSEEEDISDSDRELFADDDEISDYAKEAVYNLKAKNIISGTGGGMFAPKETATRAEAAKIIYLLISK